MDVYNNEIRSAVDLSLPGFLSSLHSMSELMSSILSASGISVQSPFLQEAHKWSIEYSLPPEDCGHLQNCWDSCFMNIIFQPF